MIEAIGEMIECSRCGRVRRARFMILRKNYKGKKVVRCAKKSVCHSIAKRTNPVYRASVTGHHKVG